MLELTKGISQRSDVEPSWKSVSKCLLANDGKMPQDKRDYTKSMLGVGRNMHPTSLGHRDGFVCFTSRKGFSYLRWSSNSWTSYPRYILEARLSGLSVSNSRHFALICLQYLCIFVDCIHFSEVP